MADHPLKDFGGYRMPGFTQIPDQLLDQQLHLLSHAELKVLLFIMRHTFGYKRDGDHLSARQIAEGIVGRDGKRVDHGTGCEIATVRRTVKRLEELGLITVRRERTEDGDAQVNYYGVRMEEGGGVAATPGWCSGDTQGVVSPRHPQDTRRIKIQPLSPEAERLADAFFAAVGESKPAKRRRETVLSDIHNLLTEGFSREDVEEACRLARERGAKGPGLLAHVIGEAHELVVAQERARERHAKVAQSETAHETTGAGDAEADLAAVARLSKRERERLERECREHLPPGLSDAMAERVLPGMIAARLRVAPEEIAEIEGS